MEWVSISECLPKQYEVVLFYIPKTDKYDREIFMGGLNDEKKIVIFEFYGEERERELVERITHWCPLPAPPKKEKPED